jgi:T5SS/PEP-CTERM-associated repeat protein
VGEGGTGTLTIENHGKVHNHEAYIGPSGTVSVDGMGSEWQIGHDVRIGDDPGSVHGVLSVTNGGLVDAVDAIVGIYGEIHGDGTLAARIVNNGIVSPGPGVSPGVSGLLQVQGAYIQDPPGKLVMEMASATSYDRLRLSVNYYASLAGTLNVNLINGFVPQQGDDFDLITASGISGTFDTLQLPALTGNLGWQVLYETNGVRLVVVLPGDYSHNNVVDAADYVVWRKTLNQLVTLGDGGDGNGNGLIDSGDYDIWRAHFGQTASGGGSGAGASANTAVPEPATLIMLMFAAAGWCVRRGRAA